MFKKKSSLGIKSQERKENKGPQDGCEGSKGLERKGGKIVAHQELKERERAKEREVVRKSGEGRGIFLLMEFVGGV